MRWVTNILIVLRWHWGIENAERSHHRNIWQARTCEENLITQLCFCINKCDQTDIYFKRPCLLAPDIKCPAQPSTVPPTVVEVTFIRLRRLGQRSQDFSAFAGYIFFVFLWFRCCVSLKNYVFESCWVIDKHSVYAGLVNNNWTSRTNHDEETLCLWLWCVISLCGFRA